MATTLAFCVLAAGITTMIVGWNWGTPMHDPWIKGECIIDANRLMQIMLDKGYPFDQIPWSLPDTLVCRSEGPTPGRPGLVDLRYVAPSRTVYTLSLPLEQVVML